jgi:hypothetical protein
MATLIAAYGSGGQCLGRCDAQCYDAKHPECTCICKGENHGQGFDVAVQQTIERSASWLSDLEFVRATRLGEPEEQTHLFG